MDGTEGMGEVEVSRGFIFFLYLKTLMRKRKQILFTAKIEDEHRWLMTYEFIKSTE